MNTEATITQNSALFVAYQNASKRMELLRAFRAGSRTGKRKKSAPAPRLITREKRLFSGVQHPHLGPLEQF